MKRAPGMLQCSKCGGRDTMNENMPSMAQLSANLAKAASAFR